MEVQNTKKEIYSALVKAVNELENPVNTMNNSYFKSKYVPLADILDIAKPVLKKHGIAVIQTPYVMYENIQIQRTNNQTYNQEIAVVQIKTSIIHENGDMIEFPAMIFKANGNTPQAIGSAITYGRRYSLSSILGIAGKEEDDDGNVANGNIVNQGSTVVNDSFNQSYQQPDYQPTQSTKNANVPQQSQPNNVNVTFRTVIATVKSKQEKKLTGNGTPYIELLLESKKNGKRISAIAKDGAYEQAKAIEVGQEVTVQVKSSKGFYFIEAIFLSDTEIMSNEEEF